MHNIYFALLDTFNEVIMRCIAREILIFSSFSNVKINITKRLRQIRNAWHSQFKLSFVFKA